MWTIGLDRSRNLLEIAQNAGGKRREVVWGNVLDRPWRAGAFVRSLLSSSVGRRNPRPALTGLCHLHRDHPSSVYSGEKKTRGAGASLWHPSQVVGALNATAKRLIESVSPDHGRALIYVWAIEQDELSRRNIPADMSPDEADHIVHEAPTKGQDVFVPWVLSPQTISRATVKKQGIEETAERSKVFNRYYHMFAQGELRQLVEDAALELGLEVGGQAERHDQGEGKPVQGLEIVQDGWERSNYYVELRRWNTTPRS